MALNQAEQPHSSGCLAKACKSAVSSITSSLAETQIGQTFLSFAFSSIVTPPGGKLESDGISCRAWCRWLALYCRRLRCLLMGLTAHGSVRSQLACRNGVSSSWHISSLAFSLKCSRVSSPFQLRHGEEGSSLQEEECGVTTLLSLLRGKGRHTQCCGTPQRGGS